MRGTTADISTASAVFFTVASFGWVAHFDLTPRQEVVSEANQGGFHGSPGLRSIAGGGSAGSRVAGGAAQAEGGQRVRTRRRPRHAGTVSRPRGVGEVR